LGGAHQVGGCGDDCGYGELSHGTSSRVSVACARRVFRRRNI
jgi:hypothetical protein